MGTRPRLGRGCLLHITILGCIARTSSNRGDTENNLIARRLDPVAIDPERTFAALRLVATDFRFCGQRITTSTLINHANRAGVGQSHGRLKTGDGGILPVICPTRQAVFREIADASDRQATLHGVVFDILVHHRPPWTKRGVGHLPPGTDRRGEDEPQRRHPRNKTSALTCCFCIALAATQSAWRWLASLNRAFAPDWLAMTRRKKPGTMPIWRAR